VVFFCKTEQVLDLNDLSIIRNSIAILFRGTATPFPSGMTNPSSWRSPVSKSMVYTKILAAYPRTAIVAEKNRLGLKIAY